ncbi:MAG: AlpA family phage regulatory protein [Ghiorsea sp.]
MKQLKKEKHHHSKHERQLGIIPQDGLMRIDQVLSVYPVSKTSLYNSIAKQEFPAPIKLSGGRTSAWMASDVRKAIAKLGGEV